MLNKKKLQALMLSAVMVLGTFAGPSAVWADEAAPEAAETVQADLNGDSEDPGDPQPELVYADLIYNQGSTAITISADTIKDLMEAADPDTFTYNTTSVTARFVKVTDLLAAAGITMSEGLHGLSFNTAQDANSYSMADVEDGPMYLYRVDGETCSYRTAKDGASGMYWWNGVTGITEQTNCVYTWQKKPSGHYGCGMCGQELMLSVTDLEGNVTSISDTQYNDLRSTADEQTFTYTAKGNTNSITANFVKAADVLETLGNIELSDDVCSVSFSDATGYSANFTLAQLNDEENPVCLFNDSKYGNMYRTAVNGGTGNQYAKYVEYAALNPHDWELSEDGTKEVCKECGAEKEVPQECVEHKFIRLENSFGELWVCSECDESTINNRVSGESRYATAMKAADMYRDKKQDDGSTVKNVVLTSGKNYPDALSAGALASQIDAPILMINSDAPDAVIAYIKEYLPEDGKVTIVGGSAAVSTAVENILKESFEVERLQGSGRYVTNIEVLNKMNAEQRGDTLLISSGKGYADSLAGSSSGCPMLLVGDKLNADQTAWLKANSFDKYVILGGEAAVSKAVADDVAKNTGKTPERLSGDNRYATSVKIAKYFYPESGVAALAYGKNFADALAAGPLAYLYQAPVVLVTDDHYQEAAYATLGPDCWDCSLTMGGTDVLSDDTVIKVVGHSRG